jgi:dienelactone hydrolase
MYAAMRRFQKSYGTPGHDFAAYIGMYTPCTTRYIDDTNVSNKPIRLFHGTPDDWNPVAACRSYVTRLRRAGADVQLVEYPGASHAFDNPLTPPAISPKAQTTRHCEIAETSPGQLTDGQTGAPFSYQDPCVELGTHYGYDASATGASLAAVKAFLRTTFAMAGT